MRNYTKILCVALALIVALSAASCSLAKEYSYKTDDVELPIGVYIYYLYNAYSQAQGFAQKSDLYDSEAGTYDGSKSFLKMEITDDDGVTAVAEQWILDKAAENTDNAVAVYHEYNRLGATLDEATLESYKNYYTSYWDQSLKDSFEGFGISFDSYILAGITIPLMQSAVFEAEYSTGGPLEVPDTDVQSYFNENYTSYKYFTYNLYSSTTDEAGEESTIVMSDDEVKALESVFAGYVEGIADGKSFSEVFDSFKASFDSDASATENVSKIDEDTEDENLKTILTLKEGEAKYQITGEGDSRVMNFVYKAPLADEKDYLNDNNNRLGVLSNMKTDDFQDFLKTVVKDLGVTRDPACNKYKPSMFETDSSNGAD